MDQIISEIKITRIEEMPDDFMLEVTANDSEGTNKVSNFRVHQENVEASMMIKDIIAYARLRVKIANGNTEENV